jgi:type I restriction enzyme, S subunit
VNAHAPVPAGWAQAPLGELIEFTRKPLGLKYSGQVTFLPMALISETGQDIMNFETRTEPKSGTYFEEGDFLLSRITPCFENGKQGIVRNVPNGWGVATTEVFPMRSVAFSAPFLAYLFRWPAVRSALLQRMEGATGRMRVPQEAIKELVVPVPPRAEQEQIVALLDQHTSAIGEARQELRDADAKLGIFRSAVLAASVSYSTRVPLEELADVRSGLTKGRRVKGETRPYPFLRAANLRDGYLDLDEIKQIAANANEADRFKLETGDVLLVEGSGSPGRLGQGWLWEGQIDSCLHQNHVFRVRPDQAKVIPRYLAWVLQTPFAKAYFHSQTKTTSGLTTINRRQVCGTPIPLPTLDEQRRIVQAVEDRLAHGRELRANVRARSEAAMSLVRSLIAQALSGQLTRNTPLSGNGVKAKNAG